MCMCVCDSHEQIVSKARELSLSALSLRSKCDVNLCINFSEI